MLTLTVHIPTEDLNALRYACAHTDEKLYVHETVENSYLTTVTLEVRSAELLFYLVRSFDAKRECEILHEREVRRNSVVVNSDKK